MPPKDEAMYASIALLWLYTHHRVADHPRSACAGCVWHAFAPVLGGGGGVRAHIEEVRGRGGEKGNKLPALPDRRCFCSRRRLQREVDATTVSVLFHLADCQERDYQLRSPQRTHFINCSIFRHRISTKHGAPSWS
ncbi:hypothetical protein FIBSPDRAFT_854870, partial [Athelia psychrophila]